MDSSHLVASARDASGSQQKLEELKRLKHLLKSYGTFFRKAVFRPSPVPPLLAQPPPLSGIMSAHCCSGKLSQHTEPFSRKQIHHFLATLLLLVVVT